MINLIFESPHFTLERALYPFVCRTEGEHLQIFGRARNAIKQKFPEAVYLPDRSSGFYDTFLPLTDEDVTLIQKYMSDIFKREKYSDDEWGL